MTLQRAKDEEEDALVYFNRLLTDPEMIAKGNNFISAVKYAIYLITKHRNNEAELLQKAMASKKDIFKLS